MRLISFCAQRWFHPTTLLTTPLRRLISAGTRTFQNSRFVYHSANKIRRLWLVHFRKDYVQRQLFDRKGDCHQCGTCCNLLFTCPMLTKKGRCIVYGRCRPKACKVFPIDQHDIDEVKLCGGQCGYSFDSIIAEDVTYAKCA